MDAKNKRINNLVTIYPDGRKNRTLILHLLSAMLRIVIINILLFIMLIVLFVLAAFAIGIIMGTANHDKETGAAYVAVTILHIYINHRMLKKQQLDTLRNKTISVILITAAYIGYLFLYR
jgi:hypothetical protein